MPERLTSVPAENLGDHYHLSSGDQCFFIREYVGGKSYKGGETNQLIFNFKTLPSIAAKDKYRRGYKERAIQAIAGMLRGLISAQDVERITFVPVPPSKCIGDPDYDDRLIRTLQKAFEGCNSDIRLLLRQTQSTEADHKGDRLSRDELMKVLDVDASLIALPVREYIVLFDDVLTTGKHFKCGEAKLRQVVPNGTPIVGVFVARRIFPKMFDEFENLD